MSGRVGDLSPKQEAALKQFKGNIADIMKPEYDDHELLRWLRARAFDVQKAEKMFRDQLAWRKDFGADDILQWNPPEVLRKYYPGGYVGHCKKGYPIWIDNLGTVDLKGMFYSVKPIDIFKYKVYFMEHLYKNLFPENSKKFGRRIDQSHLIFDMQGIGMKHLWKPALEAFIEILKIFEANYPESLMSCRIVTAIEAFTDILKIFEADYPETLCVCYIVNAPSIFPIAYNLAKPFLSEDTKKKIRVLGNDWKKELLKDIDADQLPKHWGGTMVGPGGDEMCGHLVCQGGTIPEDMYAKNQLNFVDMTNFTKATVNKGSSLQIESEVNEANCVLRWNFWTEGMDIGFGVFKKTAAGKQKASEMKEVVPSDRVNAHVIPEEGSYLCEEIGTYVIRFDNTYSYFNSKKVSYLVEVLPPDTTSELVTQL